MSISATQLRRLFAKENLLFTPSYHIIAYMLNRFTVLPQHQPPLSKVQIPAYLQKTLDIKIVGTTITQQLSNSATQQLSNSATQQLRRKGGLCSDKRAAFLFRQQHHYFFSSIFADGTSSVSIFTFTHRRCFTALGIFCALGMQRIRSYKVIINKAFYRQARQAVWFDSG